MNTKSKLNSNITNFIEIKRENRYPSVKSCRKKKYYIKSTQTVKKIKTLIEKPTWLCIGWDSVNRGFPPTPAIPHHTKSRNRPRPTYSPTSHYQRKVILVF